LRRRPIQACSPCKAHGIETVIMGASFRNQGEIEALAGCDRLTISPQLLEELSRDMGDLPRRLDPKTAATHASAKLSLDEKSFRFMLNEDAMATEKLAEGIRVFARDLRALREQVSKRLQEAAKLPPRAKCKIAGKPVEFHLSRCFG
jgi:transaldolase